MHDTLASNLAPNLALKQAPKPFWTSGASDVSFGNSSVSRLRPNALSDCVIMFFIPRLIDVIVIHSYFLISFEPLKIEAASTNLALSRLLYKLGY